MTRILKLAAAAIACTWALAMSVAQAAPISTASVSGQRGDVVSPNVVESNLVDFEGADLLITYDPTVLALSSISAGLVFSINSLVLGLPTAAPGGLEQVQLSFAIDNGPYSGANVELLVSMFQILSTAPIGPSIIRFETLDPLLYDITLDVVVNVLAANPVPEPASAGLVLAAGLALLAVRRRQGAGTA